MMQIYLDHNATTPLCEAARAAMAPFLGDAFGNPASSHSFGRRVRQALETAREQIAALLDARPDEVLFTSGATEANNLAIFGLVGAAPGSLVTSEIEHPSVLEPIRHLGKEKYDVLMLPVLSSGCVEAEMPMPDDVRLFAVQHANHETGAVQPIATLARQLDGRCAFHCDAAAAAGKTALSFRQLGVTSLTISAHKFHGPVGIGALIVRQGTRLRPLQFGGHQQQAQRPGTEPVALAVGMAAALAWSLANLDAHQAHVRELRRRFLERLRAEAAPVIVNGGEGLPHALNVSFPGCQADALLMKLDLAGVACSTGSACSSGSLLPSPVLSAMGTPKDALRSAMRFSFGPLLSAADVDEAAARIIHCVRPLREKIEPEN